MGSEKEELLEKVQEIRRREETKEAFLKFLRTEIAIANLERFIKSRGHKYLTKQERSGKKPVYTYPKELIRIKQPNGKAEIFHPSLYSNYDKAIINENREFFRNSKVQRSLAKFTKHVYEHPEYKEHLGNLSIIEAFLIYHYSLKWGVRPLNTDLEDNTLSTFTKQYEKILSTALNKLPRYAHNGRPVYHGTTLPKQKIFELRTKLRNKKPFKFGFFTSVGLRWDDGNKYMTKNRGKIKQDERLVMFVIYAKTAKDVTNLRWRPDTHEAIINHNAQYEVFDISSKKSYIEIKLREI